MLEMEEKEGVNFFSKETLDKSDQGSSGVTQQDIQNKRRIFTRKRWSVTFGEWPQTIKSDNVIITETKDQRGFYLGSDGDYYAKVIASPYYKVYLFSNNATIIEGVTYYFKVEPLTWTIIKEEGSRLLIHCDNIIFNKAYQSHFGKDEDGDIVTDFNDAPPDIYASNYVYSEIREWLRRDFLPIIIVALLLKR